MADPLPVAPDIEGAQHVVDWSADRPYCTTCCAYVSEPHPVAAPDTEGHSPRDDQDRRIFTEADIERNLAEFAFLKGYVNPPAAPSWWNPKTPLPQPIPGKIEQRPTYGSRRALEFRWELFGGDGCEWDWDDLVYLTDSQLIKAGFDRDRTVS